MKKKSSIILSIQIVLLSLFIFNCDNDVVWQVTSGDYLTFSVNVTPNPVGPTFRATITFNAPINASSFSSASYTGSALNPPTSITLTTHTWINSNTVEINPLAIGTLTLLANQFYSTSGSTLVSNVDISIP